MKTETGVSGNYLLQELSTRQVNDMARLLLASLCFQDRYLTSQLTVLLGPWVGCWEELVGQRLRNCTY